MGGTKGKQSLGDTFKEDLLALINTIGTIPGRQHLLKYRQMKSSYQRIEKLIKGSDENSRNLLYLHQSLHFSRLTITMSTWMFNGEDSEDHPVLLIGSHRCKKWI
jgi:hypothetical protein